MSDDACSNCKFSKILKVAFGKNRLVCRRYPPQVIQEGKRGVTEHVHGAAFPSMTEDGWCGEYQAQ